MPLLGSCGQLCTMAAPRGQLHQLWDLHIQVSHVSKVEQAAETELFESGNVAVGTKLEYHSCLCNCRSDLVPVLSKGTEKAET